MASIKWNKVVEVGAKKWLTFSPPLVSLRPTGELNFHVQQAMVGYHEKVVWSRAGHTPDLTHSSPISSMVAKHPPQEAPGGSGGKTGWHSTRPASPLLVSGGGGDSGEASKELSFSKSYQESRFWAWVLHFPLPWWQLRSGESWSTPLLRGNEVVWTDVLYLMGT